MIESTEIVTRTTIAAWEVRADELRKHVDTLSARERELSADLARAHADGANEEALKVLKADRRAVRDELEDVVAALPMLADQIARGREAVARAQAVELHHRIQKTLGGIAGEHPRRLERLERACERFRRVIDSINSAWSKQVALLAEREALIRRFPDVPAPPVRTVSRPAAEQRAVDLVRSATACALDTGFRPLRTLPLPADSPVAELLDWSGLERPDHALTAEELAARRRQQAEAEERERRREAERARIAEQLEPYAEEARALTQLPSRIL